VIDITIERPITFTEAASQFPSRHPGRPLSPMTIWRWAEGIGTPGGIRLETVYLGSGRYTSIEAVNRFAQAITAARQGTDPAPAPPVLSKQRRRKLAEVDAKLDKAIGSARPKPAQPRKRTATAKK
jgi:hypothetical protein